MRRPGHGAAPGRRAAMQDGSGRGGRQQMSAARLAGCRQPGGSRAGGRGGERAARGKPGPGREGRAAAAAAAGSQGAAVGRDPHPDRRPVRLPAGKLRASPRLSRPPASGARKRPHIAGGSAGGPGAPDSPRPSSAAFAFCFFCGGKLVRSLSCGEPARRGERVG